MKEKMQENPVAEQASLQGVSRRKFLTFAGGLAGATVLLDACKKDKDEEVVTPASNVVELGSGDAGMLNYLYLLQQLMADFYVKVTSNRYPGMMDHEYMMFEDIKNHEIAQREFLRNLLDTKAIKYLEFDFSSVDFSNGENVLATTRTLEELILTAYVGAARRITTPSYVIYIAKMASVQARHTAVINHYISNGTFAKPSDNTGKDNSIAPGEILDKVKRYIKSDLSASNLPN